MLKLGKEPVRRTLVLFLPIFVSAVAYGAARLYGIGEFYEEAVWIGFGTAGVWTLLGLLFGWNISSAGASTLAFLVVGYYDIGATPITLAFWSVVSLTMALTGAMRARTKIKDDRVVRDETVGFSEWTFFEFLVFQALFAAVFVAIKFPLFLYGGAVILVIALGLFLWWAFASEAWQEKQHKPVRNRKKR